MGLVGTVIALRSTIAMLLSPVAPAAQALHETLGTIADFGSSVNMSVGEHDQAYVLECTIDVYSQS